MSTVAEAAVPVVAPAVQIKPVKCVVWDLDHTLWDGVLSEGDAIALRPGIPELLRALDERGVLLSLCSKNEHDDAMAALERFDLAGYFLYPQISWNAKSQGIARIQKELNIGMDTILFIDDQPFELDEVVATHPSVRCVNAAEYAALMQRPDVLAAAVTEDSARRRLMYLEDIARKRDETDFSGTPEEFLSTLGMTFGISAARPDDLVRAEELAMRTNQLNSTGISYGMDDLEAYMRSPDHQLLVCDLSDRYGSYGKIGLALIERRAGHDHIKLLLMSCRTMSRGVGSVLLAFLIRQAAAENRRLTADFRRTDRNRQMLVTYQFSNFKEIDRGDNGDYLFEHALEIVPEYPNYIEMKVEP